ncbi:MAG: 2-hydroxyacid dehydrogenase [Nitrospiraceae bacterium]
MAVPTPPLYVSRLLPDPVMSRLRDRYQLTGSPTDEIPSASALLEGLREAEAAICTLTETIDAAVLDHASALKIVANYAVGYNNIDVAAARARGVIITNTPDVLTETTADLTWALLLGTARRVAEGDTLVRSARWTGWAPTQMLGAEVSGATLGVIGMGRIGQAVAYRAEGFHMKVLYHSRHVLPRSSGREGWIQASLRRVLKEADFITVHVPLTQDTQHLIGADQFRLMRPTAFLINTSRGSVIDESALVEALREGRLAGAGLDVYEREPDLHPGLRELRQVVLLPHLGSATMGARIRMGMICLDNISAVLEGRSAPNRVV